MRAQTFSLTSPLERDKCLRQVPPTTSQERDPVPIVQRAGWVPGPVWMGAACLVPIGVRSLDHPALNESLSRLSYPGRFAS